MKRPVSALVAVTMVAATLAPHLGSPAAAAAGTYSFKPKADAYVRRDRPTARFGKATTLRASTTPRMRSYLRFEVRGVSQPITQATLQVFARRASSIGFDVRRVRTNRWSERRITYRNAPGLSPGILDKSLGYGRRDWATVDLTDLIRRNGTYSVALTSQGNGLVFSSRETGRKAPRLLIHTTPPPETTIESAPQGTVRAPSATFSFSSSAAGSSFECSLDGGAFAPCTSPKTYHVANGGHRFQVRAVKSGVRDRTPASQRWWTDALLHNGTFETPLAGWSEANYVVPGWRAQRATLSLESRGSRGPRAARATFSGEGTDYSMYSSPKPIRSTVGGTLYRATGFVRSRTPGKKVCIRFREWSQAGAVVGAATTSCVTATSGWQSFPEHTYTAIGSNNQLELYVVQGSVAAPAAPGDSFDVDGIVIDDGEPDPSVPVSSGDPKLLALSDVAYCKSAGDEATARLADTLAGTIGIAGDTEQNDATAAEFAGCYNPAWGRHKARTRPAVGDHEYRTDGAIPFWNYFGAAAGPRGKGWYSYNLGDWHIIVLNTNCGAVGGCRPGSPQHTWLKNDLAAHKTACMGAYFHHPRWSAGPVHGSSERSKHFWDLLYQHGAEFVYSGNDHNYQRFDQQNPQGQPDPNGIRQFVVGTGGTSNYQLADTSIANLQVMNAETFGILELTLHPTSYEWDFKPIAGQTFSDSGSTPCTPLS